MDQPAQRSTSTRQTGSSQALTVRPAEASDAAAIQRIVDAAYIARIGKPPGPMQDDYAGRIAAGQAWVAEQAGRIVGVLVLENQSDAVLLDNVAVDPACQGAGIGRFLIAFAETQARQRGKPRIQLYTHALMTENQALYQRLGFQQSARVQEKGFDRIYMSKPLT